LTSVGHSLTGVSLGLLVMPRGLHPRTRALYLFGFALLANIPDLRLPGWGHDRYEISHSLFVNLALLLALLLPLMIRPGFRARLGGLRAILAGAGAWLSHLVLDSFYDHGKGVAILWPLSAARLNLSLPWFSSLRGTWGWDGHTARVVAIELVFYGALVVTALLVRGRGKTR
jgi:hypothetical protein